MAKFAFIEPYNFGSHKYFSDQLLRHSNMDFLTSFGRDPSWKWSMRFSGLQFQQFINEQGKKEKIKGVLCSNYLNLESVKSESYDLPVVMYHHENQFTYPQRYGDDRDFNFSIIEMINLQLADVHVFNSNWNLHSTVAGFARAKRRLPATYRKLFSHEWQKRCTVVYPGIEPMPPRCHSMRQVREPVILWNHRWDYDKRPDTFFELLLELRKCGLSFKLLLLGEQHANADELLQQFKNEFAGDIIAQGFVGERDAYIRYLQLADICVSTTEHEFFGMSVMEAYQAGCALVLPDKLSYPELYWKQEGVHFWQNESELFLVMKSLISGERKKYHRALKNEWHSENMVFQLEQILNSLM